MSVTSISAKISLCLCTVAAITAVSLSINFAQAKNFAITPEQIEHLRIVLEEVKVANSAVVAVLPATVVPPPNGRIAVSAPFAGTVLRVDVLVGQAVKKGQRLATIASRDLLEAMARLKQAEAELQAADAVADRYRYLADRNIAARNRAEETAAQAAKARAVVEQHRRLASINNITINEDGSYTVSSPADGRIAATRVSAGSSLDAMAPAIAIDSSEELWLEAQVPINMVGKTGVGDEILLPNGTKGRVISIGGTLDPATRSTIMLVQLPATAGLIAGQMVTLTVTHDATQSAVSVPSSAVTMIAGEPAVFVRTNEGFELTPVKLHGRSTDIATVEGDLKPGQRVASTGLAQLEKMSAGE